MLNPNDYKWSFCARDGSNETCECATPGALMRFGSTGKPEYYAQGSTWFRDHPNVRRFDYASLRPGETKAICDAETFSGSDPFPDHDKVCHCADHVAILEDEPLVTFVSDAYDVEEVEARRTREETEGDAEEVVAAVARAGKQPRAAEVFKLPSIRAGEREETEGDAEEVVAAVARAGKQPRAADVFKLPSIRARGDRGSKEAGSETGDESIRASLGRSAVRQRAARYAESLAGPALAAAAAAAAALAARRARRHREETRGERVALCARGDEFVFYGDDATV